MTIPARKLSDLLTEEEKDAIHDAYEDVGDEYDLCIEGFDKVIDAMFAPILPRLKELTHVLHPTNPD
jgi:hypothetical protein